MNQDPVGSRPRHWRLHVTLAFGLLVCVVGFTVELGRARHGHLPAWVYVVEWPLLAGCGTYLWWRLLHDTDDATPATTPDTPEIAPDDPDLAAWQAYVASLPDEADPEPS